MGGVNQPLGVPSLLLSPSLSPPPLPLSPSFPPEAGGVMRKLGEVLTPLGVWETPCRSVEMTLVTLFDRTHTNSNSSSISVVVSDIKRDWSKVAIFACPFLHNNPLGKRLRIFSRCIFFETEPDPCPIRRYKLILHKVLCLLTAHARYRQTDRRKFDLNSGTLAKTTQPKLL